MNPLNYLHLAHPNVDVGGSQITLYFVHNKVSQLSTTLVINFQDGRWDRIVEEPMSRIKECLTDTRSNFRQDPFFVHSVYLATALRWWNDALQSFNDQLIAYVSISSIILLLVPMTNYEITMLATRTFLMLDDRKNDC